MEKIICPNCGHEMIDRSVGNAIEVVCPTCGNGWAAFDDVETDNLYSDDTSYQLFIENDSTSIDLKTVSHIVNLTMFDLKKRLEAKKCVVELKAPEIKPILLKLKDAAYVFKTIPEFKHKL